MATERRSRQDRNSTAAGEKPTAVRADGAGKKPTEAQPAGEKRKAAEVVASLVTKRPKSTKPSTVLVPQLADANEKNAGRVKAFKKGDLESNSKKSLSDKVLAKRVDEIVAQNEEPGKREEEASPFDEEEEEAYEETLALVRAIDSGDEEGDEEEVEDENSFRKGQSLGQIPKISGQLTKPKKSTDQEPGVIYVGRLPHGFFEHELRAYFEQFGPVTQLRVSRSKKTGRSRGFAFLEFAEASTAEIAAKTMDNYLLFNHLLKAKVVPKPYHPDLFKGANRRFKKVPWNKLARRALERPQDESSWARRVETEEKRRATRAAKLRETMGYEFEGPRLKMAKVTKAIEQQPAPALLEGENMASAAKVVDAPATRTAVEPIEDGNGEVEQSSLEVNEPVNEPLPAYVSKQKSKKTALGEKKKTSKDKKAKALR